MAKKIELLHTTYDESGNIESQEVVHPLTSPDCIIMENGKTLDEVMGDGIATPTLTHEGTSFKVGVGDSNIEVVDGDVAGMTLKGQSYQNILPKPTTLIMETDEKEFKINDKIDSNIIIDDNIAEIATVKGKTIVNTVQEESGSEYTVLGEDLSGQSIVTTNKPEGNIKGVTLQGQTLVNTIQEPCEDDYVVLGADDGIEISAETGGHGTIEDTIGGSIKSAILKGQTLVNIHPKNYKMGMNTDTIFSINTNIDISLIKPNTKYFIRIYNAPSNICRIYFKPCDTTSVTFTDINNKYTIHTTKSDLSEYTDAGRIHIYTSAGTTATQADVENVKVIICEYQEGMENWDIPYFEGMQSVKMPVLTTTGKNLFDLTGKVIYSENNLHQIQNNEVIMENTTYGYYNCRIQYFNLKPNERYIISYNREVLSGTPFERVMIQDENRNTLDDETGAFTAPLNGKIQILFYSGSSNKMGKIRYYNIQVEEDTTATSYEPYKTNILTTSEDITLGSVDGAYDTLDLSTGNIISRTELYTYKGEIEPYFNKSIGGYIVNVGNNADVTLRTGVISDKFPLGTFDNYDTGIYGNSNGFFYIFDKLVSSAQEFKEKHIGANFRYRLLEESVKTVDLSIVDQDGNTIPHIQTQPTVTHITASSDYLIPTVTIDNNLAYDTIIKPSTLYTVRFKHDTVNADNPLTVDLGGTTQTVTSTEFTITTPSELTHNQLVFSGKNNVVSEVQVIEGDVTNIEYPFFEGMNDVKFSDSQFIARGKNLIHVSKGYGTTSDYNGLTVTRNGADQTITINGTCTLDNTSCELAPFYREFKKGERYAFSCKLISGTADRILFRVNDEQWKGNISCGLKATNSNIYETCIKTFYSDETYNRSSIRVDSGATFNNAVFKVMLEKIPVLGDYTPQYEPYKGVEVQQDVDSIPLTSDMFDQGNITSGKIVGMSYQQLNHNTETVRVKSKTLIPIKPNGKYIIQSLNKTNNRLWGWQYDKNGGYLSSIRNTDEIDVFQFDSKAHYITFVLCNQDNSAISPSDLDSMNLILQEVPQEIVLRGIGDVKDELDLTRGEYIQRIGEIKFNECQYDFSQEVIPNSCAAVLYPNLAKQKISSYNLKCDKLPTVGGIVGDVAIYENPGNIVIFDKTISSQQEFIQKYNDCTIQYVLATPIIHKVNLTNTKVIPSYTTETHYETITPSDSLIPNITIPSTLNYNVTIKPSTEYTIRANTSDNLTVDLGGATGTLSNGKVTLTTPATLTHNEVKFSGTGKVKELMVVEGNEIKDNVPFFNGMKNVEMGGIKLVNIARGATCNNLVTANTNKTQFTFTGNDYNWGVVTFNKSLLKANTTYTVYLNVVSAPSDSNGGKFQFGDGDKKWFQIDAKIGMVKGLYTTTESDLSWDGGFDLRIRPFTSGQQIVIQNPMIIEGDWTHLDEIPFIESEMIIEQPIIRSQGKNLFDISRGINYTWHSEYTINGDGSVSVMPTIVDGVAYVQSEFFFLEVGKTYTVSWNASGNAHASFVWLAGTTNSPYDTSNTFTVVEGKNKLTLAMYVDTSSLENVATFKPQIEEGSTATTYEPYKHQTLYSNRVIGYEDGCYYAWDTGTKTSSGAIASVISDVEGLNVAYVTHASSNFSFYDKDGAYLSGSMYLSTATSSNADNNFDRFGFITIPANAKYMKMACGNANTAAAKDYHLKATVTGELPLRSLPNGVCDTLNLVTGEYVQRVGEVVLDGRENWINGVESQNTGKTIYFGTYSFDSLLLKNGSITSDKFNKGDTWSGDSECIDLLSTNAYNLRVRLSKTRLVVQDVNGFKEWLSQNPITVQYELETPIVRKLGFTAKGNYREQVLDGREEWHRNGTQVPHNYYTYPEATYKTIYNENIITMFNDSDVFPTSRSYTYERLSTSTTKGFSIVINPSRLNGNTIQKYLAANAITVGFVNALQSSESYSNIQKPIFFNNVNVQFLPQNLDIQPQLTYQVRTRNSYVMDMMKPNTKYSIKLLSSSGNMLIDGTSYTLANNRTFVSPSTLTNKELIITGQWHEPMIIEGDVTAKNLPYFKGILSSYHDVDEIEVYSVNKNLFDMSKVKPYDKLGTYWWNTIVKENEVVSVRIGDINNGQFGAYIKLNVRPNSVYTLYIEMEKDGEPFNGQIYGYENGDLWGNGTFTGYANTPYHINTSHNAKYITIGFNYGKDLPIGTTLVSKNMRLYLGEESPVYIPHAHNTTLIEMPTRLETVKVVRPVMEKGCIINDDGTAADSPTEKRLPFIPVQPGEILSFRNRNDYRAMNVHVYDIDKNFISYIYTNGTGDLIIPDNCYFIRGFCRETNTSDLTITRQAWKPIQLNSLPNGVCDEIIMKPNSNKAQLVQRVGKVVLDGSENWSLQTDFAQQYNTVGYSVVVENGFNMNGKDNNIISETYTPCNQNYLHRIDGEGITIGYGRCYIRSNVCETSANTITFKNYLQQNPITVYYELATPIIHEIQLKGYPHVYENGTATLNTDVPHQTLVSYNVNQEQLINTQNETIIRHDQQIDDLYYYIEMYLEEIYQMELFRMKLELSL